MCHGTEPFSEDIVGETDINNENASDRIPKETLFSSTSQSGGLS